MFKYFKTIKVLKLVNCVLKLSINLFCVVIIISQATIVTTVFVFTKSNRRKGGRSGEMALRCGEKMRNEGECEPY